MPLQPGAGLRWLLWLQARRPSLRSRGRAVSMLPAHLLPLLHCPLLPSAFPPSQRPPSLRYGALPQLFACATVACRSHVHAAVGDSVCIVHLFISAQSCVALVQMTPGPPAYTNAKPLPHPLRFGANSAAEQSYPSYYNQPQSPVCLPPTMILTFCLEHALLCCRLSTSFSDSLHIQPVPTKVLKSCTTCCVLHIAGCVMWTPLNAALRAGGCRPESRAHAI